MHSRTREALVAFAAVVLPAPLPALQAADAPAFDLKLDTISVGFDKRTCWVHARAGSIPGNPPSVVLTMQKLLLTGSDVFYSLNEMRTDDLGATWSVPTEHADTLGRRRVSGDVTEGVADFWPKWHAKSGKLLGIGLMARYEGDKQVPNFPRSTAYAVYDAASRTWTAWKTLSMPEDARFYSAGAGCVQRVDLPDGDILLPIYFRDKPSRAYSVTVLRCGFDGETLRVKGAGSDLTVAVDRGLYEPSLTVFRGRYYLTLRNDRAGYVSTSRDGLHFSEPKKWTWDDGGDLGNYNTQQHWVTHSDALYLVYTRRGANNDHVFRHRAPLFIAQVDPSRLQVIRASERILVPERGARLGNFGVTEVNANETWVTVAEWMQTNPPNPYDYTIPMKCGSDNAVFVARIRWKTPNAAWTGATAQPPPLVLPLWPSEPPAPPPGLSPDPQAERINDDGTVFNVRMPTMAVHLPPPEKANGMALLICPGGSYSKIGCSAKTEGAQWFTRYYQWATEWRLGQPTTKGAPR